MKAGVHAQNPLVSSGGNILSPSDWISRIIWVAWIGLIFVLGSKLLSKIDTFIPGNNTPTNFTNMTAAPLIDDVVLF